MHKMLWVAIAGLCGAIIGIFRSGADTKAKRAALLFTGLCSAIFLSPLAERYFNLKDSYEVAGAGFLIGVFCIAILDRVQQAIKDAKAPEVK